MEITTDVSAEIRSTCALWAGDINLSKMLVANNRDVKRFCFVTPEARISYADFDIHVRAIASALVQKGLGPEDRVAISLDDSIELAAIFFATLATGAVPLIINPSLDTHSLSYILRDSGARALFSMPRTEVERALEQMPIQLDTTYVPIGVLPSTNISWISERVEWGWDEFYLKDAHELAFLQYTSGSTGKPKGVMHSARSALASCLFFAHQRLGLTARDMIYSTPKTFFGYGMGNSLLFPLFFGATAVLDPRWPTIATVAENFLQFSPSVLFSVPTLYHRLLKEEILPPPSLRLSFSAGAPLSERIRTTWHGRTGLPLHDGFGSTELCHVFATTYPDAIATGSIGRIANGFEYRIVGETGGPVKLGAIGVLQLKSASSSLGYWNNPGETNSKFKDGWFLTGDLFSEDGDGLLYFHGREDDRFKVFGRWLGPMEIENLLKESLVEISEAIVVPGYDGYGELQPVLFLKTAETDWKCLQERVLTIVGAKLASYKIPALCLPLSDVPYNSNGKINRQALVAKATKALAEEAYRTESTKEIHVEPR